jgi:hypothetical protein
MLALAGGRNCNHASVEGLPVACRDRTLETIEPMTDDAIINPRAIAA